LENTQPSNSIFESKDAGMLIIQKLLDNKILILVVTFLITIASIFYSMYYAEVQFKSVVNVVPPKQANQLGDAVGGMSSALREFGLTKLGGKSGDTYDFIVLMQSRSVLDSIIDKYDLHKVYDIPINRREDVLKQLNTNLEISYEKEGNYTVSFWDTDPIRAANMANDFIEIVNKLAKDLFLKESRNNLVFLEQKIYQTDSVLNIIADTLMKFSEKTMVFSLEDQAKAISQTISELKAQQLLAEINYNIYKSQYGEDDPVTSMNKKLLNETKLKTEEAMTKSGFFGNFALNEAPAVGITYLKLATEFETYSKVKAFLLPVLENARVELKKDLPSLYILDKALPAEKKDRPKRSLIVASAFLGTLFFMSFLVLLVYTMKFNLNKIKQARTNNA